MKEIHLVLPDENATRNLGNTLAQLVSPGAILMLSGELGTGKTTLVRGFLRSLGFQGPIKSPTFAVVEEYRQQDKVVYHLDLYRISREDELNNIGIREYFDGHALVLIEWPERGFGVLPNPDLEIQLDILAAGRRARVRAYGKHESIIPKLERVLQDSA